MRVVHAIAPVIDPGGGPAADMSGYLASLNQADIELRGAFIPRGPTSVDNELDDALAAPGVIEMALALAEDPATAGIIVNCMCDTAVKALRRALAIPVIGPAETAFHFAAGLGHRFGIVDVAGDTRPMVEAQVESYGLAGKFAGVRGTDIEVERIGSDRDTLTQISETALLLVEQDDADVVVLGCTGFLGLARNVRAYLVDRGYDLPVIDPFPIAARTMIAMVLEGHCHSKRAFPTPRRKGLRGYDLPRLYDRMIDADEDRLENDL